MPPVSGRTRVIPFRLNINAIRAAVAYNVEGIAAVQAVCVTVVGLKVWSRLRIYKLVTGSEPLWQDTPVLWAGYCIGTSHLTSFFQVSPYFLSKYSAITLL